MEIAIIIYIISLIGMYTWIRIAYSPKGRWYLMSATLADIFVMILPAVNTVFLLCSLFTNPYNTSFRSKKESNWLNKLFGIKD